MQAIGLARGQKWSKRSGLVEDQSLNIEENPKGISKGVRNV
ncbi:hypothetical protein OKW24_000986 [Peribacillus simplex]|nr:hypothetical protein [Peribacillus simplex]